jgi:hypothetical protein
MSHAVTLDANMPLRFGCPACGAYDMGPGRHTYRHCSECGTICVPPRRAYSYGDSYPTLRSHHDAAVARCKQITLRHWLDQAGVTLAGRPVLEVGFGGGATLVAMQQAGAAVCGQEPVAANRAAAVRLGIPAANVKADLAEFLDHSFDLVLYADSFEHVLNPHEHLRTLNRMTHRGSRAMLVLPVADSLSRRVLQRWWPHDIDDHWVFYSTTGLTELWQRHGWRRASSFRPGKYISALTIARHWEMKTGLPLPAGWLKSAGLWLNFGERGLTFERSE